MRYTIIIEEGETSFGAYVPDLPGCIAVGETREEARALLKEAVEFHLEGIRAEGKTVPRAISTSEELDIAA